jgi:hypothetical protein
LHFALAPIPKMRAAPFPFAAAWLHELRLHQSTQLEEAAAAEVVGVAVVGVVAHRVR